MNPDDRLSEADVRALLAGLPTGVMLWQEVGEGLGRRIQLSFCNDYARRVLGLSPEDLRGADAARLFARVPQDQFQAIAASYARLAGVAALGDATIPQTDGATKVFSLVGFRLDTNTIGTLFADVTEERGAQDALQRSEERFRSLVAEVPIGLAVVGPPPTAALKESNKALRRLLGYSDSQPIDTVSLMAHLVDPAVRERFARIGNGKAMAETEVQLQREDGSLGWVRLGAAPLTDGSTDMVAAMVDITARKEAEAQYQHLAFHDPLTGLPNRMLLMDRLEQALSRLPWQGRLLAVIYLDLDRFKLVNDSLGHEAGDHLLKAVADRLQESVRAGDTVARMSGDEFVVVLRDVAAESDVIGLAERIKDRVLEPVPWGEGESIRVSLSAGVAMAPTDGADAGTLLRHADTAMYEAKSAGRDGYRFFSRDMNERVSVRLRTQIGLRGALERKEFELHYQPVVSLSTGRMTALEALLRWKRPELGMVLPGEFIVLAEETGLITEIGRWVIEAVCHQIRQWMDQELLAIPVSVNLSSRQFQDPDLLPWIGDCLSKFDVPASKLHVEITETSVIVDMARALSVIEALNQRGVGVAIDDFGTGHSSLSQLKRLPVDALKIDLSFIRDIATDDADAAIVEATAAMARKLGLRTIAEGVETEAQLLRVRNAGCDEAQGFHYAKPMPASQLVALLAAERNGAS